MVMTQNEILYAVLLPMKLRVSFNQRIVGNA